MLFTFVMADGTSGTLQADDREQATTCLERYFDEEMVELKELPLEMPEPTGTYRFGPSS